MIQKSLGILAIALLMVACGGKGTADSYTIDVNLRGEVADSTLVYLKKVNEQNQPVDVDTVKVIGGHFYFEGQADSVPEMHYIFIDKIRGFIPVVVESGSVEINVQKDSLPFYKVKGTAQNELFHGFNKGSRAISEKLQSTQADLQKAMGEGDAASAQAYKEELFELQKEHKDYNVNYAKNNPNAYISVLLLQGMRASQALGEKEQLEIFENLSPEIKNTKVGKLLQKEFESSKATSIGATAPNFSAPTPTGEVLALNEVLGKATILDFWAAWCKPCRAENPNVVRIYEKYHDKGLNIMGVSLDRKAEDWKKAIADDGLTWNHVSNVKYFDEIAQLYNVRAIPATFILDENGVIVAKNLRGQALEDKIAEMLN
jgi:peroxiredoxin